MSDLDFDELDRAVNSLVSKSSAMAPTSKKDDNQNVEQSVVAPDLDKKVTEPERPILKSLAGQRGSGRFMDVIHPSSDMRSAPIRSDKVESVTPPPTPVFTRPAQPPKPVSSPNKGSMLGDFEPYKSGSDKTDKKDDDSEVLTPSSALESPFIVGAKVEKRPLGAFSNDNNKLEIELSPTGEISEKNDEKLDDKTQKGSEDIMPEELQEDLLKVESGNPSQTETKDGKSDDIPEFEKNLDQDRPVQIMQQYKEKKPTDDKNSGAIYDTNVYHKAPELDEKKKSGWLWVLWIFLLIAAGVGIGVATYFFVLPIFK